MNTDNQSFIFHKGEKVNPDYFVGAAWLNTLVPKDETESYVVNNVSFETGARTNWHTHATGQILLVTDGEGFYQEKGKHARRITKGDVVEIPSTVEHWHGASKHSGMVHIAITNNSPEGPVKWLAPVTEEEFESVHL
ncbi:MAG: cupin domain-containing protein [Sphingobacteriaceae bacterium]|nr:MAG: cupin domain-containing protein [Sphingobacteriaceae bacterium]